MRLSSLRNRIRMTSHSDEHSCVVHLRHMSNLSREAREQILHNARELTTNCRLDKKGGSALDAFLLEFGLSNKEGVALMCLAEALLRVPDALTSDRLIAEKVQSGNWKDHNGHSSSLFVNASTWGLMLTGKMVQLDERITEQPGHWLKNLVSHAGEPVVRMAMLQAMRIMGGQYVLGRTITQAIKRGTDINVPGTRFSFDMLGEGARNEEDALRYFKAYSEAIDTIGHHNHEDDVYRANGISVKLSALHSRYHYSHQQIVMDELLPRIKALCLQAKQCNIGLSIDAEEADRLDLSLDIFEALARDTALAGWHGLGFVLQAYQKRAPFVASWLIELARQSERKIMVRLVKGAYWDAEIKHAQEQGLADYPVYTRKANTDLSYQFCAEKLLDAQAEIYPQFATHNAYTAALILEIAGNRTFEFQRLHGMGDLLYKHLQQGDSGKNVPVRVYAPVGEHKDLLPYLVRRLLENGANSSFVNRFLDKQTPVTELIEDVDKQVCEVFPYTHKRITTPQHLFQSETGGRRNSKGLDLNNPIDANALLHCVTQLTAKTFAAHTIVGGQVIEHEARPVKNPANQQVVGCLSEPTADDLEQALTLATQAQPQWNTLSVNERAQCLEKAANALELRMNEFVALICYEAGRTLVDAVSEVREAIDFCRYYANQARLYCAAPNSRQGLGVFLCVSPWNFPLAIFTGQIAAALAAGNAVLAKPAEQTPLVGAEMIALFHKAGVPGDVLHFLPGSGSRIGSQLIGDPRIAGVCFTGSTDTAMIINRQLAQRQGPTGVLIAETGGQNAMVVDSTALPEQVVDDVISSAFLSAGQRCSALRVLFLQEDIADTVINMLQGAIKTLVIGDPSELSTDIGPVIDDQARQLLEAHVVKMRETATFIASIKVPATLNNGSYFAPHVFELASLAQLPEEVFGPVLHIIRYHAKHLPDVIHQINNTGYGLTLGIHSRIEMFAQHIYHNTQVGNTYINRDMVGAVVGVNPFGGQGLSGTGPKAGGPAYLLRFTKSADAQEVTGSGDKTVSRVGKPAPKSSLMNNIFSNAETAQKKWRRQTASERKDCLLRASLLLETQQSANSSVLSATQCQDCAQYFRFFASLTENYLTEPTILPGPTGEENTLSLHARGIAVCLPGTVQNAAIEIGCALSTGCVAIIADSCHSEDEAGKVQQLVSTVIQAGVPADVIQCVSTPIINETLLDRRISVVAVHENSADTLYKIRTILADRQGAIIPLAQIPDKMCVANLVDGYALLSRFVNEKTKTDNLVARGGNTQLFNLDE